MGWPFNRWPLNRGSTVYAYITIFIININKSGNEGCYQNQKRETGNEKRGTELIITTLNLTLNLILTLTLTLVRVRVRIRV